MILIVTENEAWRVENFGSRCCSKKVIAVATHIYIGLDLSGTCILVNNSFTLAVLFVKSSCSLCLKSNTSFLLGSDCYWLRLFFL